MPDERKRSSRGNSSSETVNQSNEIPEKDSKVYDVVDENEYDSCKNDIVRQTRKNIYDHVLFR